MLLHNYHTHTKRCHHAVGEDREYIESAIQAGLKTLGFSDHAPYPFTGNDMPFRVCLEDMQEYAESVRALAKEYANDIRILLGFEVEYYPKFHKEEMALLKTVSPDYLILSQHFLFNETPQMPCNYLEKDEHLQAYVSQALEGLKTGDFLYLAHPDFPGIPFSNEAIEREYRRLCEGVKALDYPLEFNLLGLRQGRPYPSETFFKIVAETGNKVVLGMDAHDPYDVAHAGTEKAEEIIKKLGLNLVTTPLL